MCEEKVAYGVVEVVQFSCTMAEHFFYGDDAGADWPTGEPESDDDFVNLGANQANHAGVNPHAVDHDGSKRQRIDWTELDEIFSNASVLKYRYV